MKKLFLLFVSIFTFAFTQIDSVFAACSATQIDINGDGSSCANTKFSVTTTSLTSDDTFSFNMSVRGTFYVDCGNGGILSGTGVSGVKIQTSNAKNLYTYTCTYSTAGVKTIRFGGITDTSTSTGAYSGSYLKPAIQFNQSCSKISSISGNLSALFPAAKYSHPNFYHTFQNCHGLTSIPEELFANYTTLVNDYFYATFQNCTGLTSIPENLFANVTKTDNTTFKQTFYQCSGLTYLPERLFANITTNGSSTFNNTFGYCTNLSGYIPGKLFAGLIAKGAPNPGSMQSIFSNDNKLATSCPSGTVQYITGYESYWNNKVACGAPITCSAGYYLPKGKDVCSTCPVGCICSGGSYGMHYNNDQGKSLATYTVTYVCGSGSGNAPTTNTTATYSSSFTPATNTCTPPVGYHFSGWLVEGTNTVVNSAFTWTYTEDKTLTAQYTVNTINITWDGASGTPASCTYGSTFVPPTPAARTGFIFNGWKVKTVNP